MALQSYPVGNNHPGAAAVKTKSHPAAAVVAIRADHAYTDEKINEKVFRLYGLSAEG